MALIPVIDVPGPGDRWGLALGAGGEIAADAIERGAPARHHGNLARRSLGVEVARKFLDYRGGRSFDRLECDGGAAPIAQRCLGERVAARDGEREHQRRRAPKTADGSMRRPPGAPGSTTLHPLPRAPAILHDLRASFGPVVADPC